MKNVHQLITETVPVFFFVYNLDTKQIEYVSPQIYDYVEDESKLLKLDPHEKLKSMINPEDREKFERFFHDLSEQNRFESNVELRASEFGKIEWLEIYSFHPRKKINPKNLVVGHIVNITEKKHQYLTLKSENESIENVLNMMAHDIRAPFNQIQMVVAHFKKRMSEAELSRYQKFIDILEETSNQSTALLDSLLNLATLKGETSKLDLDLYDMRWLVKELLPKQDKRLEQKKLQVHLEFPDYAVEAKIDKILFTQIINNLLSNAIKFTPEGGSITVFTGYDEKGQIILQISDTGIGIPEKHLKNLFKGMSKLKRKGLRGEKSTGLGLYICSQIIKIHEGRIKVESKEKEGSTFTITLPRHGQSAAYF